MYPSTEMLISVQKYKLQYRTQMTAPVQKQKLQNKHIHRLCEYIYQYNKIYTSATRCIPVQKC